MAPLWGGLGPSKRHDGSLRPTKVLAWTTSCSPNAVGHRFLPAIISRCLAHTAGHLQLDQAVELNRVLHREFLGDRLNEAVDDQRIRFGLIQATAHQVEELVVTHLRDGRLVADLGLVLFDTNSWIGIGAGMLIEQERVTA